MLNAFDFKNPKDVFEHNTEKPKPVIQGLQKEVRLKIKALYLL